MRRVIAGSCCYRPPPGAPFPGRPAPRWRRWSERGRCPTLELYTEWWTKTEACSGRKGDISQVKFYAVDAPDGAIGLNGARAHGWWVRQGDRIYLPANALGEEWLVRHEMLHALLKRGSHPNEKFVESCHLASLDVWRDSTMRLILPIPKAADAGSPAAAARSPVSSIASSSRLSACSSARVGPTSSSAARARLGPEQAEDDDQNPPSPMAITFTSPPTAATRTAQTPWV